MIVSALTRVLSNGLYILPTVLLIAPIPDKSPWWAVQFNFLIFRIEIAMREGDKNETQ